MRVLNPQQVREGGRPRPCVIGRYMTGKMVWGAREKLNASETQGVRSPVRLKNETKNQYVQSSKFSVMCFSSHVSSCHMCSCFCGCHATTASTLLKLLAVHARESTVFSRFQVSRVRQISWQYGNVGAKSGLRARDGQVHSLPPSSYCPP